MLVFLLLILGLLFLFGFIVTVGFVLWLIPVLLVGLIVGAIASSITRSPHGILGDIVIGLVGSVVGGTLLAVVFHHRPPGLISLEGIIAAIIGSVIVVGIVKAL